MNADWKPPEELWKKFLAWLDPDPETAARKYEEIRAALIAFFVGRRWACAEDMADTIIDSVLRRGAEFFEAYVGDPKNYFKAAAKNLHLDYLRKYPPQPEVALHREADRRLAYQEEQEAEERRYACLEECVQHLTEGHRRLAIAYHAKEKSAKIVQHKELAKSFGITINALRLRIFRIHGTLRDCITKCLQK